MQEDIDKIIELLRADSEAIWYYRYVNSSVTGTLVSVKLDRFIVINGTQGLFLTRFVSWDGDYLYPTFVANNTRRYKRVYFMNTHYAPARLDALDVARKIFMGIWHEDAVWDLSKLFPVTCGQVS